MSLADKAEPLTPVARLRRRKRAARVFVLLLSCVVVCLTVTVLLVNDARNLKRLADKLGIALPTSWSVAEAARRPNRFRRTNRLSTTPSRLLASDPRLTAPLSPVSLYPARERCSRLAASGASPPMFRASGDEWECVFTHEFGSGPEPSVLFIQAKGTTPGAFRTFRAKLSYLDAHEDASLTEAALRAIHRFGVTLPAEGLTYLQDRLSVRANFTSMLDPYRIILERERDDERRFNLLIVNNSTPSSCSTTDIETHGSRLRASTASIALACLPLPSVPFRT
jgi:hypothetical protein